MINKINEEFEEFEEFNDDDFNDDEFNDDEFTDDVFNDIEFNDDEFTDDDFNDDVFNDDEYVDDEYVDDGYYENKLVTTVSELKKKLLKNKINESVERETTDFEQKVFIFLNDLRDSGVTNMYGAVPYIVNRFGIDNSEASKLLSLWMDNFDEDGNYVTIKEGMETEDEDGVRIADHTLNNIAWKDRGNDLRNNIENERKELFDIISNNIETKLIKFTDDEYEIDPESITKIVNILYNTFSIRKLRK